jgi:hypothetical protein
MTLYRIIKTGPFYEAQACRWWWPFWWTLGGDYTLCISEAEARKIIRRHKTPRMPPKFIVVYEGDGE